MGGETVGGPLYSLAGLGDEGGGGVEGVGWGWGGSFVAAAAASLGVNETARRPA